MSHDLNTKNSNEMIKITATNMYCLFFKYHKALYTIPEVVLVSTLPKWENRLT